MTDHPTHKNDSDLFSFLQRSADHDLLTRDDERRLVAKAQKGGKRGLAAMHELGLKNIRLMLMIATRYRNAGAKFGFSLSDLFSEAYIGFQKAVTVYDLDHPKKVKLSTYSVWWMRSQIQRAIQDTGRTIRIPVHVSEAWQKIDKVIRRFAAERGREPNDQELAALTGHNEKKIAAVREAMRLEPASLDDTSDDDLTLIDIVPNPSNTDQGALDKLEAADDERIVAESVRVLSNLETAVIHCRIDQGMTLVATATAIRPLVKNRRVLSRERVRQLQTRALGKLRREIIKAG